MQTLPIFLLILTVLASSVDTIYRVRKFIER